MECVERLSEVLTRKNDVEIDTETAPPVQFSDLWHTNHPRIWWWEAHTGPAVVASQKTKKSHLRTRNNWNKHPQVTDAGSYNRSQAGDGGSEAVRGIRQRGQKRKLWLKTWRKWQIYFIRVIKKSKYVHGLLNGYSALQHICVPWLWQNSWVCYRTEHARLLYHIQRLHHRTVLYFQSVVLFSPRLNSLFIQQK